MARRHRHHEPPVLAFAHELELTNDRINVPVVAVGALSTEFSECAAQKEAEVEARKGRKRIGGIALKPFYAR